MENAQENNKTEAEEFSAVTVYAAQIFERLSPELRAEILEILRKLSK